MNFKELREADLSKAQIKKVHDKADDLPKNDFIKRYGKKGDAVRFATATNIVKKQLGIDEESRGVGTSRGRGGYRGVPTGRGGAIPISLPTPGETPGGMVPGTVKQKLQNMELDDKDKETIKPIIKQLQKSVKAHGKQAKQLQKDIKDEVEEGFKNDAERQAAVASLYSKLGLKGASKRSREKNKGKKKEEVEITEGRVILALDKKTKKKWQFSGGMTVKFNGKQYKTEGVASQQVLELTASFGSLKLGKKDIEDGFANGNFSVVNDGSVYQPWKN